MRLKTCVGMAAFMVASLGAGQAGAETFGATAVTVQNAAAVLTVIPEERSDVDVTVTGGARLPAPSAHMAGNRLVIDGGLAHRIQGCGGWFQVEIDGRGAPAPVRVAGVGTVPVAQLQHITVRVPRTLDLEVGGGVHSNVGESAGGRIALNGCGRSDIAAVGGALEATLNGSGTANIADISGALHGTLNGSGDLNVGHVANDASLRLLGSGDVSAEAVAGVASVELMGSGDVRVHSAADARLVLRGSGDVDVGAVRGTLSADLDGSGDIDVRSVEGPRVALHLAGSGDINVRGGRTELLTIDDDGSGGIDFGGSAGASRLAVSASGDVSVADAGRIEELNDHGSGDVHIGR